MTTDVRAAYRRCEEITWSQARNFSYGIRLLPPAKRQALAAVYAFARRIDDIGDGALPAPEKLAALEEARAGLSALIAGRADDSDQVLTALADAARRFDIPLAAFGELIDGCADDVRGVTYVTFDDLLHYCRCGQRAVPDVVDPVGKGVDGGQRVPLGRRQQPDAVGEVPGLGPGDLLASPVGGADVGSHLTSPSRRHEAVPPRPGACAGGAWRRARRSR